MQEEYAPFFERLRVHPRTLVGQEVQSLTGQGKERLRDTADAREWQEAVKELLADDMDSRVATKREELKDVFASVHSSIDLFRNNVDLVPGSKQFDKELADQFITVVKDYEQRSNGKLIGWSLPVQPLVNQLRNVLAAKRATPPTPPAPSAHQQRAAEQARNPIGQWAGPQSGITSKAGQSSDGSENPANGIMEAFFRQNGIRI